MTMREALRRLARDDARGFAIPDHVGLAYTSWAPTGPGGKVPDRDRGRWLEALAAMPIPVDYRWAYARWKRSFRPPRDRVFTLALVSRLLVGHGNASGTDVGLTVHHTWGVPVIPGTALKGLLAHYVDACYGPDEPYRPPWEQPDEQRERARYQGVIRDERGRRVLIGPGAIYRALFGAPDADMDEEMRKRGFPAGATRGCVVVHDALYVPEGAEADRPYAVDVLTVHQKEYYRNPDRCWPNDYDSPNPVAFLSVRPGVRFLFALSGPPGWTALAERLLVDALCGWGVGGKTSSGYGRFAQLVATAPGAPVDGAREEVAAVSAALAKPQPRYARGDRITVTRIEDPKGKVKFRADDGLVGHFAGEEPPQVPVGATVEVWVANVSPQGYTLTCKQPEKRKGRSR